MISPSSSMQSVSSMPTFAMETADAGYAWEGVRPSDHYVQFYEQEPFLDRSLASYVAVGLGEGATCIVVATAHRARALQDLLRRQGIDPDAAAAAGELVILDASQTLESLQVRGRIDATRFTDIVGALLERAGERVRVFGEMVALLWSAGRREEALRLEGLWSELQQTHSFTLFCAYGFDALGRADATGDIAGICSRHSHVLPSESLARLGNQDERMRAVVEWQHKATLLEKEVRERREVEHALRAVQRDLQQQVEDMRRLHEISLSLSGRDDLTTVLQGVLRAALDVHGTDMGLISLCAATTTADAGCAAVSAAGATGDGLLVRAHAGFEEDFLRRIAWVPCRGGACGTSYAERRRVVVEDVDMDAIFDGYRDAARMAGFRACHCTPLINRAGQILGVLTVHFRSPRRVTQREMRLMDLYARMTADAIENARLHEQDRRELEDRTQLLLREQRAREEAERASRLKDEFLATVSHELRTPLTAIIGWAHMLRHDGLDEATSARAIETIERAATTQAQLVEDILDVSRIITGKLRLNIQPVDMSAVVEAAVASVQLAAESKGLSVTVAVERTQQRVLGDANRLQQVIWNLLSNAIKFTPAGGTIDLRMERAGSHVCVRVSDSGEGFDADFAPFLFDRFRQADGSSARRHGGLGLGLAIVRHMVELHGGAVVAESLGRGRGATFTVRLPLAPAPEAGVQRRAASRAPAPPVSDTVTALEGMRLLVIDNDRDTLNVLYAMLKENGATVRTASSAAEAFEVLQWFNPAVLIADLAMPGEDGFSFIARLRAREARAGKQIPAVALTAYARVEDRRRALSAGFNMFVPKPVEPGELVAVVASLAGSARSGS
ncbi:MAG TPA: ATP-binding protein [Candidatus Limnocylindrales bacterium]|nr:ATP-binding protein [Candidatus Limnocylindrales bacterium]